MLAKKIGGKEMSRQHHYLDCETEYYQATEHGDKLFELRKNDKNFKLGDMVYLKEVVNGIETGRTLLSKEITFIMYGNVHGIEKGYCIFQLK